MNLREKEKLVSEAARTLNTEPEQLVAIIRKFQKEIEEAEREIAESK
ncbi:MAG: hypothetical protein QXU82_00615 [Candidatus Aenigmatarchaeota archaeon]